MAQVDLVKTGISGLDAILSSGIPRGNVILLEGGIGTGKTTMGVEFVYRGVTTFGEPGIIVLFEVSPDRLVRDAACFGLNVLLERDGKTQNHFHDTLGVPAGAAAGRQSPPRGGCGNRRPPHLRGRRGRRRQRRGRCGAARLLSRPRRRAAARKPHSGLRGRSECDRRGHEERVARRIDSRHSRPVENGRAVPRHGAVNEIVESPRAR